ncbi:MAG: hypothetical protein Q9207_003983 [Kuettlingeria erythrocarpa]
MAVQDGLYFAFCRNFLFYKYLHFGKSASLNDFLLSGMCLETVRSLDSHCNPPKLSDHDLTTKLKDSICCAQYCVALLADLPELRSSGIKAGTAPHQRLRQEYQAALDVAFAYSHWIFRPRIKQVKEWHLRNKTLSTQSTMQYRCDSLQASDDSLRTKLHEICRRDQLKMPKAGDKMPSRSPWEVVFTCITLEIELSDDPVKRTGSMITGHSSFFKHVRKLNADLGSAARRRLGGGIPRMAFYTVTTLRQDPTVVLGFTIPRWKDKDMQAWAENERRKLQGDALRDQEAMTATREALLDDLDHQASHQWNTSSIARVLQARYDEVATRSCGTAIECPSLVGRKRCTLCLGTTDFEAEEEKDLALKDRIDAKVGLARLRRYLYSCAELEVARLLRRIEGNG